jgi:uracil-DNA glycosylase family 4
VRCDGCPYSGPGIGSDGAADAELVIVGEAPGWEELRTGKPFVGPSGRLLWSTLARGAVRREQCMVTNALCCRPDDGELPSRVAIEACRERLLAEVGAHPRRVILSLGNTALRALTGDHTAKITSARGRAIVLDGLPPIIPTFHPAAVLRQNGYYKSMASDIGYAATVFNGGCVKHPGESRWTRIDPDDVSTAVKALQKYPFLAADIETGRNAFNPRHGHVLCAGICWEKNKVLIFPEESIPGLKPLFENHDIQWVWHNGKFDTSFMQEQFDIDARVDQDVMLLSYSLREEGGVHDLEQLAAVHLGADDYKAPVRRYAGGAASEKGQKIGFEKVPRSILYPYLAKDADYTFQLYHALRARVDATPSLQRLYTSLLVPASRFLQKVERRGIYVDPEAIEELRERLEREQEEALVLLNGAASTAWDPDKYVEDVGAKTTPDEFNPASPRQVHWLIYSRFKLRPPRGYQPNTRVSTLLNLPTHPFITALLRLRKISKTLGTYVYGILKRIDPDTGRVYTTFLIHGTRNGRLSSRNPNTQNVDRRPVVRNVFSAPPGRAFLEVDYSQAELRVLAALSGDEWLATIYREGRNLHDEVAKHFFGLNYTVDQKIRAKAVNFGIAYGRREHSLAKEYKIPLSEGVKMVNDWFGRMPDAHAYIEACRAVVAQGKALESPTGRRRRFGLVTPENLNELQNEASNFPMASTASDCTLESGIRIEASEALTQWDAMIVNLVHDSILIELPDDVSIARKVYDYVRSVMLQVPIDFLGPDVPFEVEGKFGRSWGSLAPFGEAAKAGETDGPDNAADGLEAEVTDDEDVTSVL